MKLILLTNIPTPYRNHLYRCISAQASEGETVDFEVWFTDEKESYRFWDFVGSDLTYPHCFLNRSKEDGGVKYRIKTIICLAKKIFNEKPDMVIVGGYFNATLQFACLLASIKRIHAILWCENFKAKSSGLLRHILRRFFIRSFREFLVPGQLQEKYVKSEIGNNKKPSFCYLPNIVDETVFRDKVHDARTSGLHMREHSNLDKDTLVFLSIMRLEYEKGADLLVQAAEVLPDQCVVLLAGEGSLRPELEKMPAVVTGKLRLLGHQEESTIVELLALANVFVLPSRNDAYPLSVIEALWAGLPLLISNDVGCHAEALQEGCNGFLVESSSVKSLTDGMKRFAVLQPEAIRKMGEQSLRIAEATFASARVVSSFFSYFSRQ